MPKRPKNDRQGTDEPPQSLPAKSRYHVERYGKSRNFAAYEEQTLIAVTLYRKGAEEVTARLTAKDRRIAELERQPAARYQQATAPPPLPSLPPEPAPVWNAPQQLPLLAAEDIAAYRTTHPRRRPASSRKSPLNG